MVGLLLIKEILEKTTIPRSTQDRSNMHVIFCLFLFVDSAGTNGSAMRPIFKIGLIADLVASGLFLPSKHLNLRPSFQLLLCISLDYILFNVNSYLNTVCNIILTKKVVATTRVGKISQIHL